MGFGENSIRDVFKDYMSRIASGQQLTYNPANNLGYRDDTYMYWTQTGHEDGMWAFKFNPDIAGKANKRNVLI